MFACSGLIHIAVGCFAGTVPGALVAHDLIYGLAAEDWIALATGLIKRLASIRFAAVKQPRYLAGSKLLVGSAAVNSSKCRR